MLAVAGAVQEVLERPVLAALAVVVMVVINQRPQQMVQQTQAVVAVAVVTLQTNPQMVAQALLLFGIPTPLITLFQQQALLL
jgi:hypothetical protein